MASMTSTSDERREVAWRLRSEVSEGECIDFAVFRIAHDVLGVDDATGARAARILADLIDPTCHFFPTFNGGFGCDRCYTWIQSMKTKPNYCPICGARVVDDE